jgi:hypothetical protein
MSKNETTDGLKIKKVMRSLESIDDIVVRSGKNHDFVVVRKGYARSCPINAGSTNAKTMVVNWVKEVTDYNSNSRQIYNALRSGRAIAYA